MRDTRFLFRVLLVVAGWLLVLAPSRAHAAMPDTVAVAEIDDSRGALAVDLRMRLSTHLRTQLAQGGLHVVAVAGVGPALRAVAPAALVTTLVVVGQRYVLIAELRDLETQAVLARGRGQLDVPSGVSPERRVREALTDIAAQLRGAFPEGQLRDVGPDPDEAPIEPIPDPNVPEPDPEPDPGPDTKNRYAVQFGLDARAARFSGLVQMSLFTNHADAIQAPLQLAGWKNHAGTFFGGLQFALRDSAADDTFYGLFQTALVTTHANDFVGGLQISAKNDARSFTGLGQLGLANVVDEEHRGSDGRFVGVGQLGVLNVHHKDVYTALQLGLGNLGGKATLHAGASLGVADLAVDGDFTGGVQASAVSIVGRDFSGLVQAGVLAGTLRTFSGVLQVGVVSYVGNNLYREVLGVHVDNGENDREDFRGLVQVGVASITDDDFRGLFQLGALGNLVGRDSMAFAAVAPMNYVDHDFYGFAQVGGLNVVRSFSGLAQLGVVSYAAHEVNGAQAGVVNLAEEVNGLQLGLVNATSRLRGVQLGAVNLSSHGGLPVTGILNLGF
jgi:hypothetical protein